MSTTVVTPVFANVCESEDPLLHCDKGDPVLCRSDRDCPSPNCGPCTPGEVITHRDVELDCVVSVCRGDADAPSPICSADHVCRVR